MSTDDPIDFTTYDCLEVIEGRPVGRRRVPCYGCGSQNWMPRRNDRAYECKDCGLKWWVDIVRDNEVKVVLGRPHVAGRLFAVRRGL